MATTNIPMDRELAAELRRLTGARTSREAIANIVHDFLCECAVSPRFKGKPKTEAERKARLAEQNRWTREIHAGIVARGDSYNPGFDPRPRPGQTKAERIAEQHRLIEESGDIIRAMGDPFYPGYDHKKLREDADRKTRERWGNDWPWSEDDSDGD